MSKSFDKRFREKTRRAHVRANEILDALVMSDHVLARGVTTGSKVHTLITQKIKKQKISGFNFRQGPDGIDYYIKRKQEE